MLAGWAGWPNSVIICRIMGNRVGMAAIELLERGQRLAIGVVDGAAGGADRLGLAVDGFVRFVEHDAE